MVKNLIILLSLFGSLVLFQNCQQSLSSSNLGEQSQLNGSSESIPLESEIKQLHYFKGGWMPAPGQVTWSHDITITNSDGKIKVQAKSTDDFCVISAGEIDRTKLLMLENLIGSLEIQDTPGDGPIAADLGTRWLKVQNKDGTSKIIVLGAFEGINGSVFALNGNDLASELEQLQVNLPVYCQ